MAINNDGITFNMTEHIDMLNEKTVGGGGYAIPKEYIVQKYLKERINPEIPTATILAALDTRIFEDKAMASAQALMGGPQKSVLEETITETETAMAPRMPQGINQGQPSPMPRPMPGQMPRQMAGLQRPPMPGRVPPQRNNGIPMMAAAGGYVPNFADGGIIGYKERGFVNRYDPDARPFTSPLNMRQPYRNSLQEQAREKVLNVESIEDKLTQLKTEPNTLENINLEKELKRQLQITEETPVTGGGYEKGDEVLYTPPEEEINTYEKLEEIDAPGQEVIKKVIEEKTKVSDRVDPNFRGMGGEADDAAAFLNDKALENVLYGPEGRPEIETVESFKDRLTGKDSAFAKEQATTKEFRDDLNKRADKAMMSTDELMLRAGLGLMSSDKPAGRELQAIGEVGTGLTNEFIKRGDKADSIRDKARMLDTQLNKAESALDLAAEKFGVNSKQHREKTRQFEKVYVQREKLADQISGDKRYVSNKTLQATQIKNTIEDRRLLAKDINDAKQLFLTKDDSAQRNINTVLNNSKFDANLPQYKTQYDTAKRYLDYMKSIHANNPSGDWARDPELMALEKKIYGGGSSSVPANMKLIGTDEKTGKNVYEDANGKQFIGD